jgi:hypothetical protein
MSNHFLDTSGLVKHYHPELGTSKVDRLWAGPGAKASDDVNVLLNRTWTGIVALQQLFIADVTNGCQTVGIKL